MKILAKFHGLISFLEFNIVVRIQWFIKNFIEGKESKKIFSNQKSAKTIMPYGQMSNHAHFRFVHHGQNGQIGQIAVSHVMVVTDRDIENVSILMVIMGTGLVSGFSQKNKNVIRKNVVSDGAREYGTRKFVERVCLLDSNLSILSWNDDKLDSMEWLVALQ